MGYLVTCTVCDVEHEIAAFEDVLSLQEAHEAKFGGDHIVEFERLDADD